MKFTFAPESTPLKGYTIKRAIHRGGFGEVYYALSDSGKEVALKLLQENSDVELRGVNGCLNLKHPHLVTIFNVLKDDDGDHWIVMEYVAGKTLAAAIEDYPRGMPMEEVRRWVTGIAGGVDYLHSHGIVHRDLKPGNIFSDHGHVKVGDVGLSKFIAPSKRSAHTQSVGTVYYMAPEVAQGRYGKEVDVYALGIMIYEMLTGKVPFDGESTGEILMKHLTGQPDLSMLPERIRPVVAAALEKDPLKRTSSVKEVERQFHAAVRGDAVTPERAPVPEGDDAQSNPSSNWYDDRQHGEHSLWGWMFKSPEKARSHTHQTSSEEAPARSLTRDVLEWIANFWWLGLVMLLFVRPNGNQLALIITLSVLGGLLFLALQIIELVRDATGTHRHSGEAKRPDHPRPETSALPTAPDEGPPLKFPPKTVPQRPISLPRGWLDRPRTEKPPSRIQRLAQGCLTLAGDIVTVFAICGVLWGLLPWVYLGTAQFPADVPLNHVAMLVASTLLVTTLIRAALGLARALRLAPWQVFWLLGLTGIFVAGPGVSLLAQYLLIDLSTLQKSQGLIHSVGPYATVMHGQVTLAGYSSFFGLLLAIRSWWKVTDETRPDRFSGAAVFNSVLVAFLALFLLDHLPWVWCLLWAAIIATTLQVTSPMKRVRERDQYRFWRAGREENRR